MGLALLLIVGPAGRLRAEDEAEPARPAYETEIWPETRLLVWAHPGQDGEFSDAANWIENGRPASRAPGRDTDVLLPAADRYYKVKARRCGVRHVTVERNGLFIGGHRSEAEVWGNLWVKDGGRAYFVSIRGPKHTFFRIDNAEFPNPRNKVKYGHCGSGASSPANRTQISHKFQVCKYGDASVEFIGKFGVSDEIMVQHGKMIVNGDVRWSGVTGKGALEVYDGATVELRGGSTLGPLRGTNRKKLFNVALYRGGKFQAGSPERPLESDAYVMLGFDDGPWGSTGFFASEGTSVRVYSSDPEKARLVFTSITSGEGYWDGKGRPVGDPSKPASGSTGIKVHLVGDVHLDGVHFDYVREGGIELPRLDAWGSWRHVTFGSHNAGGRDSLFTQLSRSELSKRQGYDSRPLTIKALKSMEQYLGGKGTLGTWDGKIVSPAAGTGLVEGSDVTLRGEGSGALTWSYDANSDGKGRITIGKGEQTNFTVPTGVRPPKQISIFLEGSSGQASQTHAIVSGREDTARQSSPGSPASQARSPVAVVPERGGGPVPTDTQVAARGRRDAEAPKTSRPAADSPKTRVYRPTDDAYIEDSNPRNDEHLKVEIGGRSRISYLKFNVDGLGGKVARAVLRMKVHGDSGHGTLRFFAGSHNDWTEDGLSAANAPGVQSEVGVFEGVMRKGETIEVDLTRLVSGEGTYSVVVRMDNGGNDVWFSSKEGESPPELVVAVEKRRGWFTGLRHRRELDAAGLAASCHGRSSAGRGQRACTWRASSPVLSL